MTTPVLLTILVLALALLLSLALLLRQRRGIRRILCRLDAMLTQALDGNFSATQFDESLLSAVEARFARYLSASAHAAGRVQEEKQAIQALIGDIAHQTKTPLANLRLYAQLLAEQPLPEQGRACAEALDAQSEKLQVLLDALVKTSRLETGVLTLHPELSDLAATAHRAATQFDPKAREKGLSLTVTLPSNFYAVFDAKWTEEALCNLLDNAIKYTPTGGAVTVTGTAYPLFCRLDVTDTGPGIPEAEQAPIFGRFYRSAAASQVPGVGLGLYLTRQIVRREGGYLKVSSRVGQGSTFSLFLPREAPPAQT